MGMNMEEGILDHIPVTFDETFLKRRMRIKPGSSYEQDFHRMLAEAAGRAHPRAAWRVGYIEERGQDWVAINSLRFTSRVLAHRVFAYRVSWGAEMEDWSRAYDDDILMQFWADAIKQAAMNCAYDALMCHFEEVFHPGKTAGMAPGSLEDWPINEQKPFFQLMSPLDEAIGVCLTDSMLMLPTKSISGLRFPTEENFESCNLCPREKCPGRRAAYDPSLYEKRFK